jgi:hypothetical protein
MGDLKTADLTGRFPPMLFYFADHGTGIIKMVSVSWRSVKERLHPVGPLGDM